MKNILYLLMFGFGMAFTSCNTNDETSNQGQLKQDTLASSAESLSTYSEDFRDLVKTTKGIFRGIDIGTPVAEVKHSEDTSAVEESEDHIDYMINYGEFENADIRYSLSESKVSGIEVNIYPKSKGSQDSIFTEFETYFTNKYGSAVMPDSNSIKWENKEKDLFILMEKKGTQKVHDIHITITSLTRQSAYMLQQTLPGNQ